MNHKTSPFLTSEKSIPGAARKFWLVLVALDVSSTLDFVPCISRELNQSIFLLKQRSLQGLPNVPRSTNPSFIRGDLLQNDRIWEQEPCVFFAKKNPCVLVLSISGLCELER